MKLATHIIGILLIGFNLFSCENKEQATSDFEYVITGRVNNGEGVKVALIPEGSSTEDRLSAVIRDGVFRFEGTSDRIKSATLRFEEDIVQMRGNYSTSTVLLEPGHIDFTTDIVGDEGSGYRFLLPTYNRGDMNKELLVFFVKHKSAVAGRSMVFGDSIKNDSMVRQVYPEARKNVLSLFNTQFENGTPEVSTLLLSEIIIKRLHRRGMFDKVNMDIADIKSVSRLFYNVDSTSISGDRYELMRDAIVQLNSNSALRLFVDFTSSDVNNVDFAMSDLLEGNEYTLVYFWFTECKPCRVFNREMKYNYTLLRSKEVEVIAVNVDDSRMKWQRSSTQDDIQWKNLYVGDDSGVESKYGIRGYPFKILFDKNREPVNVELKSVEDVMLWVSAIDG